MKNQIRRGNRVLLTLRFVGGGRWTASVKYPPVEPHVRDVKAVVDAQVEEDAANCAADAVARTEDADLDAGELLLLRGWLDGRNP